MNKERVAAITGCGQVFRPGIGYQCFIEITFPSGAYMNIAVSEEELSVVAAELENGSATNYSTETWPTQEDTGFRENAKRQATAQGGSPSGGIAGLDL